MKIMRYIVPCLLVALFLSGCGAQYRASARVLVKANDTIPSQAVLDSEIRVIRNIAPAFVSADWRYNVQHHADTSLIEISVITPEPETSASQCNQIVAKYVNMTNAPVTRSIVENAVVPKERIR